MSLATHNRKVARTRKAKRANLRTISITWDEATGIDPVNLQIRRSLNIPAAELHNLMPMIMCGMRHMVKVTK